MVTVKSSEDVFLHYKQKYGLDADGDINAVALFAFSMVENDKFNWLAHLRESQGAAPPPRMVVDWYANKPPVYFEEKGEEANLWLLGFSKILLADEIKAREKQAVKEQLGKIGRPWPAFWIGNLAGLTSNIIFAGIVVLFAIYVGFDFSFVAWTKKIMGPN